VAGCIEAIDNSQFLLPLVFNAKKARPAAAPPGIPGVGQPVS
jgi:hypothetical protein